MLQLWREGAGLEPALSEASVERFDAVAVNSRLRTAMRAWYIDYLRTADPSLVAASDLTAYSRLTAGPRAGQWRLDFKCDVARLFTVSVEGMGDALFIDPETCRQGEPPLCNRMWRHGSVPKLLYSPGASEAVLYVAPRLPPVLNRVTGVMITDDDVFNVDESMLAGIPDLAQKALFNCNC